MNFNPICVYDYETSGKNAQTCQVIQIAAVMVHSRKLKQVDEFSTWIRPDWDSPGVEEDTIQWHAENQRMTVEKFKEMLNGFPTIDTVWPKFTDWVDKYNFGKTRATAYKAPIAAGYNIVNFDNVITDRLCEKFGPVEMDKRLKVPLPRLFNQVHKFDLMDHMWFWWENIPVGGKNGVIENLTVTTLMKYMGFPPEEIANTHNALTDVRACVKIMTRLFTMGRYMREFNDELGRRRLNFKNAFGHAVEPESEPSS
jgi:DNA polymerase III epsilon subunit-like protein